MKRIHLFEFEDFKWFPNFLRICMTRYIIAIHKLLGSKKELAQVLDKALQHSKKQKIYDLCSGAGGPLLEVHQLLKEQYKHQELELYLSDLYPNLKAAKKINNDGDASTHYLTQPVDATNVDSSNEGVRSMVCSMHHMPPQVAKNILKDACQARQPICIFEISDNSFPAWLWWVAIIPNILMVFFITPMVRPMSWQQIVFTYIIPILPLIIAWDGAVSNARTYTINDMKLLWKDLQSEDYHWEMDTIKGKSKKLYLLGYPSSNPTS